MAAGPLQGYSILILEDEFLIAMDMEDHCREAGARQVVIARSLTELADGPAASADFDAAILDLRLGGHSTIDVARDLASRGIPFIFATGYSDLGAAADEFSSARIVLKPFSGADLVQSLRAAIGGEARSGEDA